MSEIFFLLVLVFRIYAANYCVKKATILGRNMAGWGIFGFISPLIALIVINNMSTKIQSYNSYDENKPIDTI